MQGVLRKRDTQWGNLAPSHGLKASVIPATHTIASLGCWGWRDPGKEQEQELER